MNRLLKVFKKIVGALHHAGFTVTNDNFDPHLQDDEVDIDDLYDYVSDDGKRQQWYASIKVTNDEKDVSKSEMDKVLTETLGVPSHPFNYLTKKYSEMNYWNMDGRHVLVVHNDNSVELFENYTKISKKME